MILVLHGKRKGKKENYWVVDLLTDTMESPRVLRFVFLFFFLSFTFLENMLWLWDLRAGAGTSLYNTPGLLANLRLKCLDGKSFSFDFEGLVIGWSDSSGTSSRVRACYSTVHCWRRPLSCV